LCKIAVQRLLVTPQTLRGDMILQDVALSATNCKIILQPCGRAFGRDPLPGAVAMSAYSDLMACATSQPRATDAFSTVFGARRGTSGYERAEITPLVNPTHLSICTGGRFLSPYPLDEISLSYAVEKELLHARQVAGLSLDGLLEAVPDLEERLRDGEVVRLPDGRALTLALTP